MQCVIKEKKNDLFYSHNKIKDSFMQVNSVRESHKFF